MTLDAPLRRLVSDEQHRALNGNVCWISLRTPALALNMQ
jgi:hypothetical protein